MPDELHRQKELFAAAAGLPPSERDALLQRECGPDAELRQRVEALLRAHDASGSYLGEAATIPRADDPPGDWQPPRGLFATGDYQPQYGAGTIIAGRYALVEKIGEGGMGEVWVAKQTEPVKRKVALKLIKAGMDSRAVLARFEQERQALALMDHPNIAKVLDAGATPPTPPLQGGEVGMSRTVQRGEVGASPPSEGGGRGGGRPFFVMELVNGLPLTTFCDQMKLTPRERLELFVPVCQAVQHAHQKGIIHRDLKPSNVLVTMIDGKPVPKVIDFGVAKAMAGKLTEESLSTQFGSVVGTLEYMSPEQAGYSGQDVDTRTDVYSLGVILYELLTGLRPLDAQRLKQAALFEMIRVIVEEEPPRPSTRLSTEAKLPSLAALRQTEPKKLMAMLRGELDWVVMKCLEKQRDRRYETANGLARDVQRYLADEPVEARPPSLGYRAGKFLRRHRAAVFTAAAVAAALVVGTVLATWGMFAAWDAQQRAVAARNAETEAREKAEAARAAETEARQKAELQAIRVQVERAIAELNRSSPKWSTELDEFKTRYLSLAQLVSEVPDHLPEWKQYLCLSILAWGQMIAPLIPHPTHDGIDVVHVELSPDNRLLVTRGKDGSARLWDFPTLRPRKTLERADEYRLELQGSRYQLQLEHTILPGNHTVWTIGRRSNNGSERHVLFWNVATGRLREAPLASEQTIGIAQSMDGSRVLIVSGPTEGRVTKPCVVQLFDANTAAKLAELTIAKGCFADFSPDGQQWAIMVNGERRVRIFSAIDGSLLETIPLDAPGYNLGFSPSGKRLAIATENQIVWLRTADWQPDGQSPCEFETGPLVPTGFPPIKFYSEDLIGIPDFIMNLSSDLPVLSDLRLHTHFLRGGEGPLSFSIAGCLENWALTREGRVVDITSLREFHHAGRQYPLEASRFAEQGRFLRLLELIDLATELSVGPSDRPGQLVRVNAGDVAWFLPPSIYVTDENEVHSTPWMLLPARFDDLDPRTMALWAKVVARGEIQEGGRFTHWDEPTWEARRQELVRTARPMGNFPFPGQAASDPSYWLRYSMKERRWGGGAKQFALMDRLVAAEPTLPSYVARAEYHHDRARYVYQNDPLGYAKALQDDLEAAQLAGPVYWQIEPVAVRGWERAWRAARQADQPPSHYELVLRWVEARVKAVPPSLKNPSLLASYVERPGVDAEVAAQALYRLGRHEDALREATKYHVLQLANVIRLFAAPAAVPFWGIDMPAPNAPLIAAMCHYHLGRQDLARQTFAGIHTLATELDANLNAGELRRSIVRSHSGIDHGLLYEAGGLIDPERVGFIGFSMRLSPDRKRVVIEKTLTGSPAMKAGLKTGDVILQVGDVDVFDPRTASSLIHQVKPGQELKLRIRRGEEELDVILKAGVGKP